MSRSLRVPALPFVLGAAIAVAPRVGAAAPPTSAPRAADDVSIEDRQAEAATVRSGRALLDAGAYFAANGGMAVTMAGIYNRCGASSSGGFCAPGTALGLSLGGLVNLAVGLPLALAGAKRVKSPQRWLAKRSERRDRMAARGRGLQPLPPKGEESAVFATGRRRSRAGSMTLIVAGATQGLAAGILPMNRAAGLGLSGVGFALLGTGIALAVSGKRRMFTPGRYAARSSTSVTPTMLTTATGQRTGGVSISGRF